MDAQKCDLCRLCLESINGCDETLLNDDHYLIESIFHITGLKVVSDLGQCEYLCSQCQSFLEKCVEFREICINNDGIFREAMTGSNHVEDCRSEFEKPLIEFIKQEPIDLGVTPMDSNEEFVNNPVLPPGDEESSVDNRTMGSVEDSEDVTAPFEELEHNSRMVKCLECGIMLLRRNFNSHKETHNPNRKKWRCTLCPKEYVRSDELKFHINAHHTREIQFNCDECGKSYLTRNSLYEHNIAVHSGEKRYPCYVCGERFTRTSLRSYHIRTVHSVARPFACQQCDQTFKTKSDLTAHVRNHHTRKKSSKSPVKTSGDSRTNNDDGVEPTKPKKATKRKQIVPKAECPQCGLMVGHYKLKKHLEVHDVNRKKLHCPHCPKEYFYPKDLNLHISANHTDGSTHYSCDQCEKSYVSPYSLDEHYLAVHSDEKRYACKVCGEKFARSSMRSYHERMAHSTVTTFACEFCDKTFMTKSYLEVHTRLHTKKKPLRRKQQRTTVKQQKTKNSTEQQESS